jgi:hypothetical protein
MKMANLAKLKKRKSTLGAPPPAEEASGNLTAPEIAPLAAPSAPVIPLKDRGGFPSQSSREEQVRIDGRSLRRTGRTLQLATRVSWEFDSKLRMIAQRDGLKIVEVLEKALDAYEAAKK